MGDDALREQCNPVLVIWFWQCLPTIHSEGCTRITFHDYVCTGAQKVDCRESGFIPRLGEDSKIDCRSILIRRVGRTATIDAKFKSVITRFVQVMANLAFEER